MNRFIGALLFLFIIAVIVFSSLLILSSINEVRNEELSSGNKLVLLFNDFLIIGVTIAIVFVLLGAALNLFKRDEY